jgi:hypothetical protein
MNRTPFLLAVMLAFAALGCSDDSGGSEDGDDSGNGGVVGACNSIVNDGPEVIPELVAAGTTPMGGTIEDGQYEHTAFDYYADPGGTVPFDQRSLSAVFEFNAGSFAAVVAQSLGSQSRTDRFAGNYGTSGTVLTLTYICPNEGTVELPSYTATPAEIRLFYRIANDTATGEIVLVKR